MRQYVSMAESRIRYNELTFEVEMELCIAHAPSQGEQKKVV